MVMEQIANLSTGNRCQGSNPCLSATKPGHQVGLFVVPETDVQIRCMTDAILTMTKD